MFRTLFNMNIERFRHEPELIDFSMYLLRHILPFVERYKNASIGYRLLICLKMPECMFPWQHGNSSKIVTASLMGKRKP